ncbi:DUF3152 domain-containing protein [Pseudactinotalea terrae]|uniref:DUF3152 domain-containing protein n=1 Tax=Pseudactinotalea terrae TaxID=1743262 RepID=UPI0012E2E7DC|nr:DUF3152 domain-containing protein [Pseudactinotalea terrae]
MSRRVVLAAAVLLVSLVAGIMLAPVVFSSVTAPSGRTTAEVTPSEPVTLSTSSPSLPTSSLTLSAEQEADLLAGVRVRRVPDASTGVLRIVPGAAEAPAGAAAVQTVRVEVEEGLDVDNEAFATFVMTVLNDPRGWGADGSVRFARTDGEADIRVVLATPATVDEMCAPLATNGRWSCGRYGHAALNADRWVFGADAWTEGGGDLTSYRQYLVNHEVGHLLGHPHESCPVPGEPAPVMVQQSINLDGCAPNGWPHP